MAPEILGPTSEKLVSAAPHPLTPHPEPHDWSFVPKKVDEHVGRRAVPPALVGVLLHVLVFCAVKCRKLQQCSRRKTVLFKDDADAGNTIMTALGNWVMKGWLDKDCKNKEDHMKYPRD